MKEFIDPSIGGNSKPEDFNIRYHVRLKEIQVKKEEDPKDKKKKDKDEEENDDEEKEKCNIKKN